MTIIYRDATPADAGALDRIFDTTFRDTFGHIYRAEDLETFRASFGVAEWEAELAQPAYAIRIAEAAGEPVAYAKLGPMKLSVDSKRPAIFLNHLYVLKDHQGAGIAQVLMDWILAEAKDRGAEELYLTVFVENHRARRFYDRYGFEAAGRFDYMVGNHADEDIIMRKAL